MWVRSWSSPLETAGTSRRGTCRRGGRNAAQPRVRPGWLPVERGPEVVTMGTGQRSRGPQGLRIISQHLAGHLERLSRVGDGSGSGWTDPVLAEDQQAPARHAFTPQNPAHGNGHVVGRLV